MTKTMVGSKNVTNSEKGAKMEGEKGYILKFSMELMGYNMTMTIGGSKNVTNSEKRC